MELRITNKECIYTLGEMLGYGSYGTIYSCKDNVGSSAAIKIVII